MKQEDGYISGPIEGDKTQPDEGSYIKKTKVSDIQDKTGDVKDMYDYLKPLLRKDPKHIVLHVGSNNPPYKSSNEIFDEILKLKPSIKSLLC